MKKSRRILLWTLIVTFLFSSSAPITAAAGGGWSKPVWDKPSWDSPDWDKVQYETPKEKKKVPDEWKKKGKKKEKKKGKKKEKKKEKKKPGKKNSAKKNYTDKNILSFIKNEFTKYLPRIIKGLANMPAEIGRYISSGQASKELKEWWINTKRYFSSGELKKDLVSGLNELRSAKSLKTLMSKIVSGEIAGKVFKDLTIGALADIEAFATGIDPRSGRKVKLPERIASIADVLIKPMKLVGNIPVLSKVKNKLVIGPTKADKPPTATKSGTKKNNSEKKNNKNNDEKNDKNSSKKHSTASKSKKEVNKKQEESTSKKGPGTEKNSGKDSDKKELGQAKKNGDKGEVSKGTDKDKLYNRSSFRKGPRAKAESEAPKNASGKMICPTCGKDIPDSITINTKKGPLNRIGYDLDHYPDTWAERVASMKVGEVKPTRKEVLDEYNKRLRVQCHPCNISHAFEGVEGTYKGVKKDD